MNCFALAFVRTNLLYLNITSFVLIYLCCKLSLTLLTFQFGNKACCVSVCVCVCEKDHEKRCVFKRRWTKDLSSFATKCIRVTNHRSLNNVLS